LPVYASKGDRRKWIPWKGLADWDVFGTAGALVAQRIEQGWEA